MSEFFLELFSEEIPSKLQTNARKNLYENLKKFFEEHEILIKGKSKKGNVLVEGLVIPPFSETGPTFAGFPSSFLPLDLSYIGMAHSHPEGTEEPSLEDLNNFFGLVSIIVKAPYNEEDIFAWDSSGNPIPLSISE